MTAPKLNETEKEMLEFFESVADRFPSLTAYFAECQKHFPVSKFRNDKEMMMAILRGEPEATMWHDIDSYLGKGLVVEAIKHHRSITGHGLKESKQAIDARRDKLGLMSTPRPMVPNPYNPRPSQPPPPAARIANSSWKLSK